MIEPKIVLDTNILLASIGSRSPFRWIFDSIIEGRITLCISNEILLEYQEVIARKANSKVAENVVNFLTINPHSVKVDVYFNFGLIRSDPSDNKFVDCAIAAGADHIVSNDRHFRILKNIEFPKVSILNLSEFEHLYR